MEMKTKAVVKVHRLIIEYGDNEFSIDNFVINHVNIPFLDILVLIQGPNFVPWLLAPLY
jgi:hypothetical protein